MGIRPSTAKRPGHIPEAFIRLLRYQGSSRETGARSNVLQDVRLTGTVPDQIATARRRLRRWLPATVRLGTRGRLRVAMRESPLMATRKSPPLA